MKHWIEIETDIVYRRQELASAVAANAKSALAVADKTNHPRRPLLHNGDVGLPPKRIAGSARAFAMQGWRFRRPNFQTATGRDATLSLCVSEHGA